ncbi:hypothetical protein T07_10344 [Trichinella nelsoni]|uniref:DUF5641 domain-containing protein n=1 Tax=Trichinella nelsoni TaxID=6336 RepID=A0A0V0RVV9_9BILA|nr:hypothetical protein T07_10344 [Trichinella nelsoni]
MSQAPEKTLATPLVVDAPALETVNRQISHHPHGPTEWKLGVITATLPGSDGVIRSERVQTARGVLTRLSRSLFLLEPTVSS